MKKYHLAYIRGPLDSRCEIFCSDPKVLQMLFEELQKKVPSCRILIPFLDLDNNICGCSFDKLNSQDKKTSVWLLQELLKLGWEPFAIGNVLASYDQIFLRLEIND